MSLSFLFLCHGVVAGPSTRPATAPSADEFLNESDLAKCWQTVGKWQEMAPASKLRILQDLVDGLTSEAERPLVNMHDTFLVNRPEANRFVGHGAIIAQDIFLLRGKAAWAIEVLLDADLPKARPNMTKTEIEQLIREAKNCLAAYKRGSQDREASEPNTGSPTSPAREVFEPRN